MVKVDGGEVGNLNPVSCSITFPPRNPSVFGNGVAFSDSFNSTFSEDFATGVTSATTGVASTGAGVLKTTGGVGGSMMSAEPGLFTTKLVSGLLFSTTGGVYTCPLTWMSSSSSSSSSHVSSGALI